MSEGNTPQNPQIFRLRRYMDLRLRSNKGEVLKDATPRPGADLAVSGKISENTSHTTWKSFTNHETSTEIHLLG